MSRSGLTASDFYIDAMATRSAVCPAGHGAVAEYEDEDAPERVEIHFARAVCEPCALRARCPVGWRSRPELGGEWSRGGAYVLSADLARMNIARRRAAESDGQWRKRYGLRAGIEGTNSEMKRRHGLGRLRVRGGERVRLAVYLKAPGMQRQADGRGTTDRDGRDVGPAGCPGHLSPAAA